MGRLAPRALLAALLASHALVLDLFFEAVDAVAHAAAVGLQLRLAGAAPADAAREPREGRVLPGDEARQHVASTAPARPESCPRAICARCAKMSRMSCARSMTLRSVASEMERTCAGVSSRSKMMRSAPRRSARTSSSSSLPRPSTVRGSMACRRWMISFEHDDARPRPPARAARPSTLRPRRPSRS